MDTQWQVDTIQACQVSETIYQAALNHSQENGAASVIQVSQSREIFVWFCAYYTPGILYSKNSDGGFEHYFVEPQNNGVNSRWTRRGPMTFIKF